MAMNASKGAIDSAYGKARDDLTGNDYYKTWFDNGTGASNMYANALGMNGADGYKTARDAFQASPGYDWRVQQGMDALNRTAAARGGLAGGGQSMALMDYGQKQASNEWANWLNGLNGVSTQGMAAAAGKTGQQNQLANLDYRYGGDLANIYMGGTKDAMSALREGGQQQPDGTMAAILGGLQLGSKLLPVIGGMGDYQQALNNGMGNDPAQYGVY
jgi:hypothetical protein